MNNNIEVACLSCCHYDVCCYKEAYKKVYEAIFATSVKEPIPNGGVKVIPLSNFECLGDITVTCKFYKRTDKYLR